MKHKIVKQNIIVKIPRNLFDRIHEDLDTPHDFAFERIGFLYSSYKKIAVNEHLIILNDYQGVNDKDYIKDTSVGGRINSNAIRNAINLNIPVQKGCFAIHKHSGKGMPSFSTTDITELPDIAKTFTTVFPHQANGLIVFSNNKMKCLVWLPNYSEAIEANHYCIVGNPFDIEIIPKKRNSKNLKRYSRQSFLGQNSQDVLNEIKIGVIGLGGGGSHIVQQLAYLGFQNLVLMDDDVVDESNLNRLVGARSKDVKDKKPKTKVAERLIKAVLPTSQLTIVNGRWENNRGILESCDIIIGCVDSYLVRRDLESFCRRYLIPYLDIGMVVNRYGDNYKMVGQVILSMPGYPCMQCLGFLNEMVLKDEAQKYGDAGEQPQVIWANGVLASTAIGILVNILCKWSNNFENVFYLSYDGNFHSITDHPRLEMNGKISCTHYPIEKTGPIVQIRESKIKKSN